MFRAPIERWRALASRIAPDLDVRQILGVIQRESFGAAGTLGSSGDLGLMQVAPGTLDSYNKTHPNAQITRAQMLGTSPEDAAAQIRAGSTYLRSCLKNARALLGTARAPWPSAPASDEQILFSDLAYGCGFGALKAYRAAVLRTGAPDTFEALAAAAPGPPSLTNPRHRIPPRKFAHARAVLYLTRNDGEPGTPPPRIATREPEPRAETSGAPLLMLAAAAAFFFATKRSAAGRSRPQTA